MPWPLSWILATALWMMQIFVIAHAATGLLQLDPKHPLVRLVRAPAEPLLRLVRPLARKIPGPIDWSPAIALVGLQVIKIVLT